MSPDRSYTNDVFISYSHIDNQPVSGISGWVDTFQEHLQNFVSVHVGRRTKATCPEFPTPEQ